MQKLLPIFLILLSYTTRAQSLHIDSTRFITGHECCTNIQYAIPTADKGILFVGYDSGNPGGIIPSFLLDTVEYNVLIGKMDSNQQISWLKVYGGSMQDQALGACQTPDGGYAVLAQTMSTNGDVTANYGSWDMWLLRIDAFGNLLWQKNYGSTQDDEATSIANTPDGGFILLGTTNGADHDVPFHYGSMWTFDWLVIKTDSLGNKQWSKDIGGTADEQPQGSIISACGGYYIVSGSNSTDYNCNDSAWHPGVNTGYDYYLLKLDTAGNVLWDSSYGGSGTDNANNAIYDTRDSTIVITGFTGSNDYMVTGLDLNGDMWVIKVNKNGTLLWQSALGDSTDETGGDGICAAPGGGYMAYGGISPGSIGRGDAWIVSLDSNGNEITNKDFGGNSDEQPSAVVPYLNGYIATGGSGSSVFTEGSCNVNYSGAYVSYIGYWPLAISSLQRTADSIILYPNPVATSLTITSSTNISSVAIINLLGQIVYTYKYNTPQVQVDISELANGIYFVKVNGTDVKKFIKE